jgi:hypothetical protein
MDIISAYREAGTYRGAAVISGTTPKTVRRVIARHEAGGGAPPRVPREHNYDTVAGLVAERARRPSAWPAGWGPAAEPAAGRAQGSRTGDDGSVTGPAVRAGADR